MTDVSRLHRRSLVEQPAIGGVRGTWLADGVGNGRDLRPHGDLAARDQKRNGKFRRCTRAGFVASRERGFGACATTAYFPDQVGHSLGSGRPSSRGYLALRK